MTALDGGDERRDGGVNDVAVGVQGCWVAAAVA